MDTDKIWILEVDYKEKTYSCSTKDVENSFYPEDLFGCELDEQFNKYYAEAPDEKIAFELTLNKIEETIDNGETAWATLIKGMLESNHTIEELKTIFFLKSAWDQFVKLEIQHQSDRTEFCDAIHRCQHLLAVRLARRAEPDIWVSKAKINIEKGDDGIWYIG